MPDEPDRGHADLGPILAGLGLEICHPLERLRGGLGRLVEEPSRPLTDAERGQAQAMLALCDDLGRLTRECLGIADR
jgi:hypothetical protein